MEYKETELKTCYATVCITEDGINLPVLLWDTEIHPVLVNKAYDNLEPNKLYSWRVVDVKWGDQIVAI